MNYDNRKALKLASVLIFVVLLSSTCFAGTYVNWIKVQLKIDDVIRYTHQTTDDHLNESPSLPTLSGAAENEIDITGVFQPSQYYYGIGFDHVLGSWGGTAACSGGFDGSLVRAKNAGCNLWDGDCIINPPGSGPDACEELGMFGWEINEVFPNHTYSFVCPKITLDPDMLLCGNQTIHSIFYWQGVGIAHTEVYLPINDVIPAPMSRSGSATYNSGTKTMDFQNITNSTSGDFNMWMSYIAADPCRSLDGATSIPTIIRKNGTITAPYATIFAGETARVTIQADTASSFITRPGWVSFVPNAAYSGDDFIVTPGLGIASPKPDFSIGQTKACFSDARFTLFISPTKQDAELKYTMKDEGVVSGGTQWAADQDIGVELYYVTATSATKIDDWTIKKGVMINEGGGTYSSERQIVDILDDVGEEGFMRLVIYPDAIAPANLADTMDTDIHVVRFMDPDGQAGIGENYYETDDDVELGIRNISGESGDKTFKIKLKSGDTAKVNVMNQSSEDCPSSGGTDVWDEGSSSVTTAPLPNITDPSSLSECYRLEFEEDGIYKFEMYMSDGFGGEIFVERLTIVYGTTTDDVIETNFQSGTTKITKMTLNPDAAGEIQINVDLNVTNHSDEDQANVDITVKLYDQDGLQVGSDIINLPIPNIVTKSSDISAVNQTIQLNQGSYVLRAIAENMGEEIETANNSTEVWITVIEKQQEVNIPGLNPILIVVLGFAVVYVLKTTKH